jgi:hypothetical protein
MIVGATAERWDSTKIRRCGLDRSGITFARRRNSSQHEDNAPYLCCAMSLAGRMQSNLARIPPAKSYAELTIDRPRFVKNSSNFFAEVVRTTAA